MSEMRDLDGATVDGATVDGTTVDGVTEHMPHASVPGGGSSAAS